MSWQRIGLVVAAAFLGVAALSGCGGDDLRDGDAAEQLDTVATPEQEQLLREEAERVEDIVEGAISDLREVRSVDDLEQRAADASDELAEARARIEALDIAEEQQGARDQLVNAVETLENEVRELQATIADGDPIGAVEAAGRLSLDELRAAIERVRREANQ